jgi:hypothetical protein
MRADICDSDDEKSVERFKSALSRLEAKPIGKQWAVGVDVFELQIGDATLTVFSDAWSIDIEGPDHLVTKVLNVFNGDGKAI